MLTIIYALIAVALLVGLAILGVFFYRKSEYHKKQVESSLKMVPMIVTIPRDEGEKTLEGNLSAADVSRELIANAENMYNAFFSLYRGGSFDKKVKNFLFRSPHISFEIVAAKKEILFYVAAPHDLITLIEKAITSQYPEANIKKAEEHNIFTEGRGLTGVAGGYLWGFKNFFYPLKTYTSIEDEPLEAITNALSMMEEDEGAAIQLLIRPVDPKKVTAAKGMVQKIQKGPKEKGGMGAIAGELMSPGSQGSKSPEPYRMTPLEEQVAKEIDRKSSKFGFETRIRVIVSAQNDGRAELLYNQIKSAFNQFSDLSLNGLKIKREKNIKRLVTSYIFRYFDDKAFGNERFLPTKRGYNLILNSEELASIYHFPNALIKTPGILWLPAKASNVPVNLSTEGTLFAKTDFRGEEKMLRISENDKLRHVYIIGQTGTGKSNLMTTMMINDIRDGNGVCFIDPHGEGVEKMINLIPKERAEDVVIFDASDTERPLGLNLFEAKSVEQQDFVIQEALMMLYRLYDPGKTGIMGPRFEHWFRNAALALMADPAGGTFIEIPRIFTDEKFLAEKLKYVTDPVVKNFWITEMGQTADFHKSEMLGWFVGKFGAFMTNTTMRNILGQVKSSINIRELMDNKKILLVNLSKGSIGEINMQLLGMIFISKIQMAAMSRADIPDEQRVPFSLYIDEFQNFATDNIAQIFSELRKYKLALIVANQYIGQLREDIRDAVFGNVGTLISFRVGSEDGEFVAKQYEPEYAVSDIINQENYHAIIKLIINGLPSRPFNIIGLPPESVPGLEVGKAIRELSRLKYGRPREEVDAEVAKTMKINMAPVDPAGVPREGVN